MPRCAAVREAEARGAGASVATTAAILVHVWRLVRLQCLQLARAGEAGGGRGRERLALAAMVYATQAQPVHMTQVLKGGTAQHTLPGACQLELLPTLQSRACSCKCGKACKSNTHASASACLRVHTHIRAHTHTTHMRTHVRTHAHACTHAHASTCACASPTPAAHLLPHLE